MRNCSSSRRAARSILFIGFLFGSGSAARADILLSITGSASNWISADGLAVGWSSPVETTDLTILALLDNDGGAPGEATAYLTTSIGPGVTAASEIAETTIALPAWFDGWVTLFVIPVLPAGSYWLSFSGSSTLQGDDSWAFADPAAIGDSPGFNYIGYGETVGPQASYLPGSSFYIDPSPSGYEVEVIANSEPPSAVLMLGSVSVLAGLVLLRRRMRGQQPAARLAAQSSPKLARSADLAAQASRDAEGLRSSY